MIIYKNVDYLSLGIQNSFSIDYLSKIVLNNEIRTITSEISLVLTLEYDNVKLFNIYSSKVEKPYFRIGFIRLAKTKARGQQVKLDLGGTFFTHHDRSDIEEILEFFHISHLKVYRVDYCLDYLGKPPMYFKRSKIAKKKYKKDYRVNYKTTKSGRDYLNWFSMMFSEFTFKAYDKYLDISQIDGNRKIEWDPHYKKYSTYNEYITRLEIRYEGRGLKKLVFENLSDIYLTAEKKHANFLKKYFPDKLEIGTTDFKYKRREKFTIGEQNLDLYFSTIDAYLDKIRKIYFFKNHYCVGNEINDEKIIKREILRKFWKTREKIEDMIFPNTDD